MPPLRGRGAAAVLRPPGPVLGRPGVVVVLRLPPVRAHLAESDAGARGPPQALWLVLHAPAPRSDHALPPSRPCHPGRLRGARIRRRHLGFPPPRESPPAGAPVFGPVRPGGAGPFGPPP